ncbi:hypothetical protein ACGLHS_13330 [Variovorax sp. VaC1]|uniref:hypothetical protein n=1 Tax=Variovorax sp. VaC1 TaxID=3373132 RepID=UPI0037498A84
MTMQGHLRQIDLADIGVGEPVISVKMPYEAFVTRFGEKHSDHPADWDAPGPVELWFFELPWGHKIILEYHLAISHFSIHLESLEVDAVLDFLDLRGFEVHVSAFVGDLLREQGTKRYSGP